MNGKRSREVTREGKVGKGVIGRERKEKTSGEVIKRGKKQGNECGGPGKGV